MPRPRKFRSAKALADAWEQYKVWCNDQEVLTHDFSSKNSEFVSAKLKRSVTYTIEGFCVWAKISRSIFDTTYAEDERFSDIVTRMREECEVDARMKFELGIIDTKLAPPVDEPARVQHEAGGNPYHDPASGRFTNGGGGGTMGKTKYAPSPQRSKSGIQLKPKKYARLCGVLGTQYPKSKAGEIRIIRDANKQYTVKADGYGGFETIRFQKIK